MIQAFLQHIHVGRPYLIPDHSHPVFELIHVLAGSTEVTVDGITTLAGPGDLLVFHPGRVHRESVHRGPFRIVVLRFEADALRVPIPEGDAVLRLTGDQRLRQTAAELAEEGVRADAWSQAMQEALLTVFVVHLRRALAQRPASRWLDGALQALAAADGPAEVDRLARSQGVAPSTLRARVKAATGVPPRRYALLTRLERARDLLRETSMSVADVAAALGFSSPQHLSRQCTRLLGVSPRAIRARPLAEGARMRPSPR